jgi:hypothetical protein
MADAFIQGEKLAARQQAKAFEGTRARKTSIELLMSTVMGRRFVWDELSDANVFAQTFIQGSPDGTAFMEGKRAAGNRLLMDVIKYTPTGYLQMTRENNPGVELQEQDDDNG